MTDATSSTLLDPRVEISAEARALALSMGSAATHAVARLGRVGMTAQGRAQALPLLIQIAADALACHQILAAQIAVEDRETLQMEASAVGS